MRILVTGANGFVGRALVPVLVEAGHEVIGVTSKVQRSSPSIQWLVQDLSRPIDPANYPSTVDVVIHLAQSKHYQEFPEYAPDIFNVNVSSTMQLLEYARQHGASSFILTSSGGIYGYRRQPIQETDSAGFVNFYQASKYMAESMIQFYAEYFSTVVLRPFFIYGEGQSGMLIPGLVERINRGEGVTLYSEDGTRLNPVHVDDMTEVIQRSLQLRGREIINVAGPDIVSIRQLASIIGEALGKQPRFEHKSEPSTDNLVADIKKLKMVMAFEPRTGIHLGVRRVVEAYLRERQQKRVPSGVASEG